MAKMTLEQLVEQLRKAFGSDLHAVVLFGSAVAGEHIAKRSDYNILVVADRLDVELLGREGAIARAWAEAGHPPPLTMTLAEWRASSDVFPMEYADVLEHHRVLYGTLSTEGITVDPRNLRLQLEHEVLGKLLRLRAGIMTAGGDSSRLIELMAASLSTYMVIFRGLLRLLGEAPPTDYEALTRLVAQRSGMAPEPFLRVINHVRGAQKIAPADAKSAIADYHAGARQLVEYVDRLGEK